MQSFKEIIIHDRRLVILRSLKDVGGNSNDSLITKFLDKYNHKCSRDEVRGELLWLADYKLVKLDQVGETMIATITRTGSEVAEGRKIVPGVAQPEFGE